MEKIYNLSAVNAFVRQHWLLGLFLVVGLVLLVGVRVHAESYTYGVYVDDEYHTVHEGINLLVHGRVDNFRAQESVRWLVRAFYPYALMYMNTHMGGNVVLDGWSYPGHDYVVRNFIDATTSPAALSLDPNLRDLFHALRVQYILFVFVCVAALLGFFFKRGYYLVAFGGCILLGFSLTLLAEQTIFYIEPAMLASIGLLLLLYSRTLYAGYVSRNTAILLGFLAAFMVATKFSALFFVALPLVLFWCLVARREAWRRTGVYLASFVASYVVINFPAFLSLKSFNEFLHDLSSNFWQYAAGSSSDITVAPGIPHLGLIVYQLEGLLGYAMYLMPVIILFAWYYASRKERMIIGPVLALVAVSIWSLASQHVYMVRNAIPFYLPIAIVSLLAVEIVARHIAVTRGIRYASGAVAIVAILWLGGIVMHAGGVAAFASQLWPNDKAGLIGELQILNTRAASPDSWYAVGFPAGFFSGTPFAGKIVFEDSAPTLLNNKNYPALVARFSSLPKSSVVAVENAGNNKHLTHYILPQFFDTNVQFGNYYVFFNKQ